MTYLSRKFITRPSAKNFNGPLTWPDLNLNFDRLFRDIYDTFIFEPRAFACTFASFDVQSCGLHVKKSRM